MITTQGAFKRTIAAAGISFVAGPVIQAQPTAARDAVNEQPRVRLIASQQSRPVRRPKQTVGRQVAQADLLTASFEGEAVVIPEQPNRGRAMIEIGRKAAAFALLGSVASGVAFPWIPAIDSMAARGVAVGATVVVGLLTLARSKSRYA